MHVKLERNEKIDANEGWLMLHAYVFVGAPKRMRNMDIHPRVLR